jgi:hypothetical protein
MTAQAMAEMLGARRASADRWQARCPAHQDRSPSLTITDTREGTILIRCWAGCRTADVLSAVGLSFKDLFAGPPPSPEALREATARQQAQEARARARRFAHGQACDRLMKLERIVDELGAQLMRLPEGHPNERELGRLFHSATQMLHEGDDYERGLRA